MLCSHSDEDSQQELCLTFPEKLLKMMELVDEMTAISNDPKGFCVAWLPNLKGFVVRDPEVFVRTIMSRFFKHRNLSSFTRRLQRWGFYQVDSLIADNTSIFNGLPDAVAFEADFFHPDAKEEMAKIGKPLRRPHHKSNRQHHRHHQRIPHPSLPPRSLHHGKPKQQRRVIFPWLHSADDQKKSIRESGQIMGTTPHGVVTRNNTTAESPMETSAPLVSLLRHRSFDSSAASSVATNSSRFVSFYPHVSVHEYTMSDSERQAQFNWFTAKELHHFKIEAKRKRHARHHAPKDTGIAVASSSWKRAQ